MTPLALRIKRQAARTVNSKRRIAVIVALLAVTAMAILFVAMLEAPQMPVSYRGVQIVAPVESEVCIGAKVHFPIIVNVAKGDLPTQGELAEAWCHVGVDGPCTGVQPANLRDGAKRLPLLKPRHIEAIASRDVPTWLKPGVYEFWHSIADTAGNVEGYSVEPIVVVDCK